MKFNLCTLTPNGLTVAGDGLWLFGNDVLKGKGLSWNWGDIRLNPIAEFTENREHVFGEEIEISTFSRGVTDEKQFTCELLAEKGGMGEDNNSYGVVSNTIAARSLTPDVSMRGYDHKFVIKCKLDADIAEIEDSSNFAHEFLKRLMKTKQLILGRVALPKQTPIAETRNSKDITEIVVKQPIISSAIFENSTIGTTTTKSKMKLELTLSNFAFVTPMYLWLYEVDLAGKDLCSYENSGFFVISKSLQKLNSSSIKISTMIDLSKFNIRNQVNVVRILGYGPPPKADLAYGISLDMKGEIRLPLSYNQKISYLSPVLSGIELA